MVRSPIDVIRYTKADLVATEVYKYVQNGDSYFLGGNATMGGASTGGRYVTPHTCVIVSTLGVQHELIYFQTVHTRCRMHANTLLRAESVRRFTRVAPR